MIVSQKVENTRLVCRFKSVILGTYMFPGSPFRGNDNFLRIYSGLKENAIFLSSQI